MKTKELAVYFLLAYLISWVIWSPYWLPSFGFNTHPILPYQHGIGGFGPMLSAFITTAIFGGRADVRKLWRSLTAWRPLSWLLIAILTPPALALLGGLVAWINDGQFPDFSRFGYSDEFPELGAAGFLVYNAVFFGFGEETGWRGFALPRLQGRYNALVSTIILSVFWAGWHIPIFTYRPGYVSMDFGGVAGWYFSILTGAVLLTWLFNGSRGSILACALFHGLIDVVFMSEYGNPGMMQYIGIAVTILGIALLFVFGRRNLAKGERVKALD
ncbi:MAG: CPBP family intramembrane metalloprotease [Lewinellaceae bacterium]|nr:CPBP family intramembrane metalloprotease [Lewinella sp.]MCB9279938.1 CPBP family intramembrane metalloprotease [Lewinellaceae bacterium]